jgi:endonuclease I
MKLRVLSFLLFVGTANGDEVLNPTCNIVNVTDAENYYMNFGLNGNPATWTRQLLNNALRSSHRNVVAFINITGPGDGDVQEALTDMDRGLSLTPDDQEPTIRLVYSDRDFRAGNFGVRGWRKEHLWPVRRGVGAFGADLSDLHNLRAAISLVNDVRDEKYFGMCGILVREETCQIPAEGAAQDTCSCNRLFQPPASTRGDIARALMYMDIRYDGTDPFTLDLTLTDCPFNRPVDMAYKSQMLTWHNEDPPDEQEIFRNQRACERWQGNRNPFIDFPDLAEQIYSTPLPLPAVGERLIYEFCENIPTQPPTFTPNECEMLNPGDINFFLINSMDPDTVGIFTFEALIPGFQIFLTDNAWDGEKYLENEGTVVVRLG